MNKCDGFKAIDDVLIWAGVNSKSANSEDIATARGALLVAFDMEAEEHPRVVGNLTEDAHNKVLDALLINGRTMTVSERS